MALFLRFSCISAFVFIFHHSDLLHFFLCALFLVFITRFYFLLLPLLKKNVLQNIKNVCGS